MDERGRGLLGQIERKANDVRETLGIEGGRFAMAG